MGKTSTFNQEQKDQLSTADDDSSISIKVNYLPDNNLKHNEPKDMSFTFTVDPDKEAGFPGGQQQLKQYLKQNIRDNISEANFKQHQLAAVKFTVDEKGAINNPHIFWTSEDEKIDKLFLDAISRMPNWKPAEYANGKKVKQDHVLLVGDMKSCVVNMVGIRLEQ